MDLNELKKLINEEVKRTRSKTIFTEDERTNPGRTILGPGSSKPDDDKTQTATANLGLPSGEQTTSPGFKTTPTAPSAKKPKKPEEVEYIKDPDTGESIPFEPQEKVPKDTRDLDLRDRGEVAAGLSRNPVIEVENFVEEKFFKNKNPQELSVFLQAVMNNVFKNTDTDSQQILLKQIEQEIKDYKFRSEQSKETERWAKQRGINIEGTR